ncbi:MAG: hypothetical protein RIA72_07065 [Sphingopyxis sp.]|uniref:hypothetical protein n=1 Tax=Sphingopyxis sp. TaxID=1908224 RepID=UPI0032EFE347
MRLDFFDWSALRRRMSEDAEARHELIRRLFYLATIAAEDATALATEGQSRSLSPDHAKAAAATLRELGMRIEILSSAISELIEDVGHGAGTA